MHQILITLNISNICLQNMVIANRLLTVDYSVAAITQWIFDFGYACHPLGDFRPPYVSIHSRPILYNTIIKAVVGCVIGELNSISLQSL